MRVGLIGAGYAGSLHARRIGRCGTATMVGVCDPVIERAASLARPLGAPALARYQQLDDVDCLYICAPPDRHDEIVRFALERRTPFLLEKPLAPDLATAQRLADAISNRPLINAVGYHWRYRSDVDALRRHLEGRSILLAGLRWIDRHPDAPWWRSVRRSGGQVVEQVTHLLDLARVFLGEATAVGAAGHVARVPEADFPDTVVTHLAFSSGALATLMATCAAETPSPPSLELVTANGSAIIDDLSARWTGEPPFEPPPPADPYQAETDAFIAAVASGDPASIRIDVGEALLTHALACRIQAAAADHAAPTSS